MKLFRSGIYEYDKRPERRMTRCARCGDEIPAGKNKKRCAPCSDIVNKERHDANYTAYVAAYRARKRSKAGAA